MIDHDTVEGAQLASTKFRFTSEYVLFGKLRPYLGKISRPSFDGVCSTDILPIKPSGQLDRAYLAHYLSQPTMVAFVASRAARANLPRLSPTVLSKFPIPLPPLNEQHRIAAILDRADAIRAKRREALAHLDSLTQAIFHDMFGTVHRHLLLSDLVTFYSGGTPTKSREEFWNGDIPWLSAKDLKADDLWDSRDHIAERVISETNIKLLPANTITLVVRGMILAHTLPVSVVRVPATINQDLKALLPKADVSVGFLAAAIRSRAGWALARVSTAAHGTRRLESGVLASIPVPSVSTNSQLKFASHIRHVATQRTTIQRALAADDELFASLQSRAFKGDL